MSIRPDSGSWAAVPVGPTPEAHPTAPERCGDGRAQSYPNPGSGLTPSG
jgi:hypothetical protein